MLLHSPVLWSISSASHPRRGAPGARTVGFEAGRFAVPAACLVDGLDEEDVAGATLEPVDGVVVLLDVGDDHPAVHGVVETCGGGEGRRFIGREGTRSQRALEMERSWEPGDLEALLQVVLYRGWDGTGQGEKHLVVLLLPPARLGRGQPAGRKGCCGLWGQNLH